MYAVNNILHNTKTAAEAEPEGAGWLDFGGCFGGVVGRDVRPRWPHGSSAGTQAMPARARTVRR